MPNARRVGVQNRVLTPVVLDKALVVRGSCATRARELRTVLEVRWVAYLETSLTARNAIMQRAMASRRRGSAKLACCKTLESQQADEAASFWQLREPYNALEFVLEYRERPQIT